MDNWSAARSVCECVRACFSAACGQNVGKCSGCRSRVPIRSGTVDADCRQRDLQSSRWVRFWEGDALNDKDRPSHLFHGSGGLVLSGGGSMLSGRRVRPQRGVCVYTDRNPPTHCPNGHQLGPRRVLVGWDNMHSPPTRTWTCRTCDAAIYMRTATWHYQPSRATPDPSPSGSRRARQRLPIARSQAARP